MHHHRYCAFIMGGACDCGNEEKFMRSAERAMEKLFYIQNAGYVGNCLRFWKADRCGYTCHIEDALLVGEAEAKRICASRPNEDFAIPASEIRMAATLQVDGERMRR